MTDEETEAGSRTSGQSGISKPSRLELLACARKLREVENTPRALRANSLDSRARYGDSPPPPPPPARPPAGLRPRCLGKAGRSPAEAWDTHVPHVPSLGPGTRPFSSETQGPSFTTLWKMVERSVRAARVAWPLRATVHEQHAPLSPPKGPNLSDLLA